MSTDPLAARLAELLDKGSIGASRLSTRMRRKITTLFDACILVEEPAGKGRRVRVNSIVGLQNWIDKTYPHGLDGYDHKVRPRATGVVNLRDSKRGGKIESSLVHIRGFHGAELLDNEDGARRFPVGELTEKFGAATLVVDDGCTWRPDGIVCTVENLEVFLCIEEVLPDVEIAVFTRGRLSTRVLNWLVRTCPKHNHVLHAGDYDPVGLAEYIRLRDALGPQAQLFIPDDLEELLLRYGNEKILRKSRKLIPALRKTGGPEVLRILDLFDRHGRALEQEALLIGNPAVSGD